jgi:Rrf2 family protein
MLSNTSKYAIRAVIYLAVNANEKKIGIKKIAEALEIPSPFLGKILQVLVRKKILSSTKGPNGGFGVGKNPDKVTLYDIIYEMDGADLFESCLIGAGSCESNKEKEGYCALHGEFVEARNLLTALYRSKTVGELARKAQIHSEKIIL